MPEKFIVLEILISMTLRYNLYPGAGNRGIVATLLKSLLNLTSNQIKDIFLDLDENPDDTITLINEALAKVAERISVEYVETTHWNKGTKML